MAGEVSKDITKRFLLPADIVDAHEQGLYIFTMQIISHSICTTVVL